jgi:transcriptional regulator with XRE-family HTH domain
MKSFGKRLKSIIEESGNTYTSIADQIGCTRAHISNLVSDTRQPSEAMVKALSHALGVREEWLATGEGKKESGRANVLDEYEDDIISGLRELPTKKKRITADMVLAIIRTAKESEK